MTFPVLLDEADRVSNELYRLRGLPMSVFVNRDGVIARIHIGAMTAEQIETYVGEILKPQTATGGREGCDGRC